MWSTDLNSCPPLFNALIVKTKGLRPDARDQPLPIGSLLDFSYDFRYCSIVTKDMVTNGHECDRHHPLPTITNHYQPVLFDPNQF